MRLRPRTDPQRDAPRRRRILHVVHDQHRLFGAIDVQQRLAALNVDTNRRPYAGLEIDVRLVYARLFSAKPMPRILRLRDVLRRMIAAKLILRASIGRTEVERGVPTGRRIDMKRNPDKSPSARVRAGGRNARDVRLDRPIAKVAIERAAIAPRVCTARFITLPPGSSGAPP